jgi:hypothetical protein
MIFDRAETRQRIHYYERCCSSTQNALPGPAPRQGPLTLLFLSRVGVIASRILSTNPTLIHTTHPRESLHTHMLAPGSAWLSRCKRAPTTRRPFTALYCCPCGVSLPLQGLSIEVALSTSNFQIPRVASASSRFPTTAKRSSAMRSWCSFRKKRGFHASSLVPDSFRIARWAFSNELL